MRRVTGGDLRYVTAVVWSTIVLVCYNEMRIHNQSIRIPESLEAARSVQGAATDSLIQDGPLRPEAGRI